MKNIVPGVANIFVICISIIFTTLSAFAEPQLQTQTNVTIKRLGTHQNQTFYFNLAEGFKVKCKDGLIYCPTTNPDCKNFYALALSAKIASLKLAEIRYEYDPNTKICNCWLLAIDEPFNEDDQAPTDDTTGSEGIVCKPGQICLGKIAPNGKCLGTCRGFKCPQGKDCVGPVTAEGWCISKECKPASSGSGGGTGPTQPTHPTQPN